MKILSLKFFFNRQGAFVLSLLTIGWVLSFYNLRFWETNGVFYWVFCFLAFLITLVRFIPWYPASDRGFGIEEHFEKSLVPTAYILVFVNVIHLAWGSLWPLLFFTCILLGIIQTVNGIMIYFYFKDKDKTPPSFFARQKRTE